MRHIARLFPVLALTVLVGVVTASSGGAAPVTRTVLGNGLTVVACPHYASDVAGVFVGFRVGADLDEPPGIRALIHEHNSARVRELLETDARFASLQQAIRNGRAPAWGVEWDYLRMRASCPSRELRSLMELVSEGVFSPQIQPELLDPVRQRLAKEYEGMPRRAAEQTYYLFREAMLGDVAAARPVFGTPESTAAITTEQLSTFAQDYLQAANAVVAVVAPLPSEEIVALVRGALGSLAHGTVAPSPAPPLYEYSRVGAGSNPLTGLATVVVGVPVPAPGGQGFRVGQLLYHVLDGAEGRLVRDRGLLHSLALNLPFRLLAQRTPVKVLPVALSRQPHLAIYAECDPGAVEDTHQALLRHLNSLRDGAIRPEELDRAKQNLINACARVMLGPATLAAHLGQIELLGGGSDSFDQIAAEIQGISKEEIIAATQAHFQNHYIGVQMPETTTESDHGSLQSNSGGSGL